VFAALFIGVANCAPCCHTCPDSTVKFWALDTPNNECAETCIDPSNKLKTAEFWVLTGGKGAQTSDTTPCATAKFHTYNRTDTLGAGPVQLMLDKYLPDSLKAPISTMAPSGLVEGMDDTKCADAADQAAWTKHKADFAADMSTCGHKCMGAGSCVSDCIATTDGYTKDCAGCFGALAQCTKDHCLLQCLGGNTPACTACVVKAGCDKDFSTCSGLTPPSQSPMEELMPTAGPCTTFKHGVFADMHDGDQKKLTLENGKLTIVPHGNNQTWVVEAMLDAAKCTAVVDFNVPGKPGPPPVNLTAALYALISKGEGISKHAVEFTDPSGTIGQPGFPLNMWVALL